MSAPALDGSAFPPKCVSTASAWTIFKAKLFGRKYVERSGRYTLVMYRWRGVFYITRYDAL